MRKLSMRLVAAALLAGSVLAVPAAAPVSASPPPGRCLSANGADVNAYLGVRRADVLWVNPQSVQDTRPSCLTVVQGRTFYRPHGWTTQVPPGTVVDGETVTPIYPEDYRPARRAPMRDFLSKIKEMRYVVSQDGEVVMAVTVVHRAAMRLSKLGTFGDVSVAPDTSNGFTISAAAPQWHALVPLDSRELTVGQHTVEAFVTLTAQHCDGFGADPAVNCMPAGETRVTNTVFEVVPRRR